MNECFPNSSDCGSQQLGQTVSWVWANCATSYWFKWKLKASSGNKWRKGERNNLKSSSINVALLENKSSECRDSVRIRNGAASCAHSRSTVFKAKGPRNNCMSPCQLWWLVLCQLRLRDAQRAGKMLLWLCLWVCSWERLAFASVDWVKMHPHQCGGHHPIHWGSQQNKKADEERIYSAGLAGTPVFSFGLGLSLGLSLTPSASLVRSPLDSDWITPPSSLGLQFAESRLWDFPASVIKWANSYN